MGKINVLGFDVANLIAAGEVVDRPASVVKELCENSIDAGATSVTVDIRHGGTTSIRVSDNGSGIEPDDVPLTVLRHATSKIACAEDLEKIGTLGFRGEALAATAAVCHLKIATRTKGSDMGTVMQCDGGEITEITESGCAEGTTIIVRELFYNVPARRKFLKKDATECAAVTAVMEKIALSSPEVSIKYIADGEVKFMTAGDGNLRGAIYSVYGKAVANRMSEVDRSSPEGIRIRGFVSEPDVFRSNKNSENFFINGRYVKSHTAMAALEQAYATRIPSQKFPVCVLNIEINPGAVDVNVHPSKLEVKFANERVVFETVYYAVLNALTASSERPEFQLPEVKISTQKKPVANAFVPVEKAKDESPERAQIKIAETTPPIVEHTEKATESKVVIDKSFENRRNYTSPESAAVTEKKVDKADFLETKAETVPVVKEETKAIEKTEEKKSIHGAVPREQVPEYRIVGEAYNTYVIVELSDRILMIDKHAAHERILFDEMCANMLNNERHSQVLMFPAKITVDDDEAVILEDYSEKIKSLGFEYIIKGREVEVSQIPSEIGRETALDMISSLAAELSQSVGSIEATEAKYFEAKLYQASCKAAIKGGRVYGTEHIKWICDRLLKQPDESGAVIKTCPHGRPVAFEIKKTSIDRQFDRIK